MQHLFDDTQVLELARKHTTR
jgi:hypothetical protein